MADQLSILPASIVAGESISATIPSSFVTGYSLAYQFSSPTPISVSCSASGTIAWTLLVTSAQTLLWPRGTINFAAMLTHTQTGVTTCVDSGVISIAASPLTISQYAAAVVAIDAAILTFASNPNRRVNLGTMSVEYKSMDELISLRSYYKSLVAQETGNVSSSGGFNRIFTRFA